MSHNIIHLVREIKLLDRVREKILVWWYRGLAQSPKKEVKVGITWQI
ncbi:hypothetical protein C8J95_10287 [Elizabethkingia sp. YR214]|nr:hypothetical protein C8J95_10287 [Elizabethkingia sp. YR214]